MVLQQRFPNAFLMPTDANSHEQLLAWYDTVRGDILFVRC